MATVENSLDFVTQKVILHDVSWETYDRLLNEHSESPGTRFNYDRGNLEIMIVSLKHEKLKHKLETLVEVIAEELGIDLEGAGSTTFRHRDVERGFEPDACFYFKHAARIRLQNEIDLTVDPPPDLVIEIDITRPSLNKLPIYAGLGISEVWRFTDGRLKLLKRHGKNYNEQKESSLLSGITSGQLNQWIEQSRKQKSIEWLAHVRKCIRPRKGG